MTAAEFLTYRKNVAKKLSEAPVDASLQNAYIDVNCV
jgi:hypothetical protein